MGVPSNAIISFASLPTLSPEMKELSLYSSSVESELNNIALNCLFFVSLILFLYFI